MTKIIDQRSKTAEKIVKKALELFNKNGVEYVGMRELAGVLGMRVGNITYYFPTKDHLVNRLSLDLAEENNRAIVPMQQVTLSGFFAMLERVFHNHINYRCLMLSFVHLLSRNPIISRNYSTVQTKRNQTWASNILALQEAKFLKMKNKAEVDFLVSSIGLIARFWISEAAISHKNINEQQQVDHYIKMIARIFLPFTTAKGRPEILVLLGKGY